MFWDNYPDMVLFTYAIIVAVGIILILKLSKDKTRKISSLRLFVQIVAVIAVFMGLLIGPFNQPTSIFYPLGISHLVIYKETLEMIAQSSNHILLEKQ